MATEDIVVTTHSDAHAHGLAHPPAERHHPYHLVDPSPWPFVGTVAAFVLVVGLVMWMHEVGGGP